MEQVLTLMIPEDTTAVDRSGARVDPLADWVTAARAGDRAASRRVLEALAPRLLRVVRGVLGARHPEVEDTFQEALVSVTRSLGSFRGEGEVEGYAVRITLRAAIAARRKHRARTEPLTELEAQPEPATEDAPQNEQALATRRRELLRELLDTLPEAQAESLVLRAILGLSLEETASTTGVPVNTVRSRIRLAREALRSRIENDPRLVETLEIRA